MGENILLVEDDAATRRNVSRFLRSQGYQVIEAGDGLEALAVLADENIDVVISDFVLPNVHGLNLVNEIRSKWPGIAVIVMSGYLSEDAGKVILEPEADFLAKPFDLNQLGAKVYGVLLRKELSRA